MDVEAEFEESIDSKNEQIAAASIELIMNSRSINILVEILIETKPRHHTRKRLEMKDHHLLHH